MTDWTAVDAALDLLARKVADLERRLNAVEAQQNSILAMAPPPIPRYIDPSSIWDPL